MFLPLFATAQPSWVNLEFQTDNYGGESTGVYTWLGLMIRLYLEAHIQTLPTLSKQYFLPSGEYNLVVNDAFGDGICCDFGEGWFGLRNDCGLDLYVFDFSTSQITVPFVAEPCALPVPGMY